MPAYNADKLATLISEMRKALERLETLRLISQEEFLENQDKTDSAKYNFIVATESVIDICSHIISQNGYRIPDSYSDAFEVLSEQGTFSKKDGTPDTEFLKNLKAMAKFRNRLVHIYWEINEEQIYAFLQNNLNDFKIFLDKIATFLNLKNLP